MPHVVIDLPDPKPTLDVTLARQFTEIQRQLMGLVKSQQDTANTMRSEFLTAMQAQQTDLTDALERLLGSVERQSRQSAVSDALLDSLRGIRQTLAQLPQALRPLSASPTVLQPSAPTKVTVNLPEKLLTRIDGLESALLQGPRRFHHRTFGSNW